MREQFVRSWMFAVFLLCASLPSEAACVDPSTLVRSTVNVIRIFGDGEERPNPDQFGVAGTAWFVSPQSLVTAAHVAQAMHLAPQTWTEIEIRERQRTVRVGVRIARLVGSGTERLAVLELASPFTEVSILQVRTAPLVADEQVMSLAYPGRRLRFAGGRFVRFETDERLAGAALLEMHDGDDRLVLDHGASGAPVLDCEGRVVAVVTNVLSQTINVLSQAIRVSTAWRTPNVVAIPIAPLKERMPVQ